MADNFPVNFSLASPDISMPTDNGGGDLFSPSLLPTLGIGAWGAGGFGFNPPPVGNTSNLPAAPQSSSVLTAPTKPLWSALLDTGLSLGNTILGNNAKLALARTNNNTALQLAGARTNTSKSSLTLIVIVGAVALFALLLLRRR